MKVMWRKSAIQSLLELDSWRSTIELPPIGPLLRISIEHYFHHKDLILHVPGRAVIIRKYPVDLRMVLISVGKSDPYKVFFRLTSRNIEIFLIRHPHQKPL
jgi:hypothetical protein